MSHIIGRPDDDLLEVMLGQATDPEQAFIGGSAQDVEESDRCEDRLLGDEPAGRSSGADHSQHRPATRRSRM